MKCFLLMCSGGEESSGNVEYALVGIDEAKAKEILHRKELFQMAKAKDPELYKLVFWDRYCYFYTSDAGDEIEDQLGGEDEMHKFISEGLREVSEEFSISDDFEARTDLDMMVVTKDSFYWTTTDRHGDGYYETRQIKYEAILDV